jgi:hypothetical protein
MLRRTFALTLPLAVLSGAGFAQTPLAPATGAVLLSVAGRIRHRNAGERAQFDAAMLDALPQLTITAQTPWYSEVRSFTGAKLRDVLAAVGAEGSMLRAVALNDYRVDIPIDDVRRHDVIVARLLDGKPMAVREKGPLFVMYPFDTQPALRNAVYFSRCIWQLQALEVL